MVIIILFFTPSKKDNRIPIFVFFDRCWFVSQICFSGLSFRGVQLHPTLSPSYLVSRSCLTGECLPAQACKVAGTGSSPTLSNTSSLSSPTIFSSPPFLLSSASLNKKWWVQTNRSSNLLFQISSCLLICFQSACDHPAWRCSCHSPSNCFFSLGSSVPSIRVQVCPLQISFEGWKQDK